MTGLAARSAAAQSVPRYFVHDAYVRAIPPTERGRLVNYLSALLRFAREAEGRLLVDAPRLELADLAGVSEETTRRLERRLEQLHLVRTLDVGRQARVLEVLPPPTIPLRPICEPSVQIQPHTGEGLPSEALADRAVDNSVPESLQPHTGEGLSPSPARGWSAPIPLLWNKRVRERVDARVRASGGGELRRPGPRVDFVDRATGELSNAASDELERAGQGPGYRLTRPQRAGVRAAVRRRLEALQRSGASEAQAEELARRDLQRVLAYALRADRPAAHLAAALRRDWHSHVPEGSEAAAVAARGPAAERPVEDLDSREGPGFGLCRDLDPDDDHVAAPTLERALARFRRAIDQAPLSRAQRARLRDLSPRTAGEALELARDLERAAVAAQVSPQ